MPKLGQTDNVSVKTWFESWQHVISLIAMLIAIISVVTTVRLTRRANNIAVEANDVAVYANNIAAEANDIVVYANNVAIRANDIAVEANNVASEAMRLAVLESPILLTTAVHMSPSSDYGFSIGGDFRGTSRIDDVLWVDSVDVLVLTGSVFSLGVIVPRTHTTHRIFAIPEKVFSTMEGPIMSGYSVNITVHEPLLLTPNNYFAYMFIYAIAGNGTVVTTMQIYKNENGIITPHARMIYNLELAGGNSWIYDISGDPSDSMLSDANIVTEHFREVHRLLNEYR